MLAVINKITPVKVSESQEQDGLDTALHGEHAYDLDDGRANEPAR